MLGTFLGNAWVSSVEVLSVDTSELLKIISLFIHKNLRPGEAHCS